MPRKRSTERHLTPMRQQVYICLCKQGRPVTAYELLALYVVEKGRPVAPPTIYRTLAYLCAQGMVLRLASTHSYIPHEHHQSAPPDAILLCDSCGQVQSVADTKLNQGLQQVLASAGFQAPPQALELHGTCATCCA